MQLGFAQKVRGSWVFWAISRPLLSIAAAGSPVVGAEPSSTISSCVDEDEELDDEELEEGELDEEELEDETGEVDDWDVVGGVDELVTGAVELEEDEVVTDVVVVVVDFGSAE